MQQQIATASGSPIDEPISSAYTRRELEIIRFIVDGCSNQDIALELHISPRTVQAHIAAAMRKARVGTRTQLAISALRDGSVTLFPAPPATPVAA